MAPAMSTKRILLTVTGLTAMLPGVVSTNCRGSFLCRYSCPTYAVSKLQAIVSNSVDMGYGNEYFPTGEHIACVRVDKEVIAGGGCCAFYQRHASGNLQDVKAHLDTLVDHGCMNCGSDPTVPGAKVKEGELTVNYVHSTKHCNGNSLCRDPDSMTTNEPQMDGEEVGDSENLVLPSEDALPEVATPGGVSDAEVSPFEDTSSYENEDEDAEWSDHPSGELEERKVLISPDERLCMVFGRRCKRTVFRA